MAGRAGDNAGGGKVSFTKASAQRIANAVRAVENGNRDAVGMPSFPRAAGGGGKASFMIARFDGSWPKGGTLSVQKLSSTQTVSAVNLFANIATSQQQYRFCALGRDGTAWYLIATECP